MTMRQWFVGTLQAVATLTAFTAMGLAQQPIQVANQPGAQILEQPITLDAHKAPLEDVLRSIRRQVDDQLMFDGAVVDPKEPPVTYQAHNLPLGTVLRDILQGRKIAVLVERNGELVILKRHNPSVTQAASGIIAGRVTDSTTGAGLSGVTIRIDGSKQNTLSSDSGYFQLKNVPSGEQVVTARLFGYRPVTKLVTVVDSQRTTVHIVMASIPTVLSGVVTTATGTQRKVEIGNDITTLNVDSIRQVAPITSVTDLLEARVPGLTVMHTSGTPGDPARLRLRGAGSISENNDPIVIVDGIRVYASQSDPRNNNLAPGPSTSGGFPYAAPSPIDQIDPNNIETIEVFKGPSASALYGSDAANGVIVITTKHGRAGPTQWSLDLGLGTNWIPGTWPENRFLFGFNQLNENLYCNFTDPNCTVDSVVDFQALNDPAYTMLSHGSDQTASLNVSGGVPTLTYHVTAGAAGDMGNLKLPGIMKQQYEDQYGPIPSWMVRPDQYQTWTVSGTMTAQPRPGLNATLQSSLFSSDQQRSSLESGLSMLEQDYINRGNIFEGNAFVPLSTMNPLITGTEERVTDNSLTSNNALTVNWSPRPWLPINMSGGINTMQRTDVSYIPYGVYTTLTSDTTGYYGLGRGTSRVQTLNASTTVPLFSRRLAVAVGGNLYDVTTNDFAAYTNQLAPGVSVPTTFIIPAEGGNSTCCHQSTTSASTYGWFLEPQFNILSKFFVSPGFRLDGGSGGSTSAGSVDGLSAFPKISLSYLLIDRPPNHPFAGFVTQLRPRFSFGLAGTQPSPADRLRLFDAIGAVADLPGQAPLSNSVCSESVTIDGGATYTPAVCLTSLGNTLLRPERSSELEGGFDLNLWDSRLQVTYTHNNKTRHDAILSVPVAPSVSDGFGGTFNIAENIGEVRNTGTEATVNVELIQRRAISWAVGANLTSDQNIVVSLNPGQAPINLDGNCTATGICDRVVPGYPLFSRWARPIVAYADANHDGILEPNEIQLGDSVVYVGQETPNYQLNLTSDLTLLNGHLGIHATIAYQQGMSQFENLSSTSFLTQNNAADVPLATQAAVVAAACNTLYYLSQCANLQGGSEIGLVQTVSTLRFNDVSVNYELPRSVASWFHAPRMVVALQGSNLGLHSNYHGKDPDVNAFSTVSAGDLTEDTGQIPTPRTWWLKLTLGN